MDKLSKQFKSTMIFSLFSSAVLAMPQNSAEKLLG
jgi:hypothetical protein